MSERIKPVFILFIWKLLSSQRFLFLPLHFPLTQWSIFFQSEKRIENKIAFAYGWRRIKGSNQTSKKTNSELSKDVVLLSVVWLLCQLFLFCWSWSEIGECQTNLSEVSLSCFYCIAFQIMLTFSGCLQYLRKTLSLVTLKGSFSPDLQLNPDCLGINSNRICETL